MGVLLHFPASRYRKRSAATQLGAGRLTSSTCTVIRLIQMAPCASCGRATARSVGYERICPRCQPLDAA